MSLYLYYMYISGAPTIVADNVLFGREPGADLSDLFYINNQPAVRMYGDKLSIALPPTNNSFSFVDYYTEGTLIPSSAGCYSYSYPEELSSGNTVNLTISLPVRIEHFWDYALELAKGQTVEEQYTDTVLTTVVTLQK